MIIRACIPILPLAWSWWILSILLITQTGCRDSIPTNEAEDDGERSRPGALITTTQDGSSPSSAPTNRTVTAATSPAAPRSSKHVAKRRKMVARQIKARGINDERVLEAMRNVPRHWFVPPLKRNSAYADRPLPIGYDQTISQPYIVALMTALLNVRPHEKVLEIGTGSGYQAAVLSELSDHVYTIEIVEPLARRTMKVFKEKGYDTIHARIGDGYRGWPEQAPFDVIIVTCAPEKVPQPLVEQLAVGGRMCIPLGSGWAGQELVLMTKRSDGTVKRKSVIPVRFVPMRGEVEGKNR